MIVFIKNHTKIEVGRAKLKFLCFVYLKLRYFQRRLSKALKKLTLFFHLNSVPLKGQDYEKQKGPGTCDQSLLRLQNKLRKISLLVMYYLIKFDDLTQSGF